MTLGTSLTLIATLIFIVLGVRFISKKKKWRLVAKIAGGLFLFGVLIGLGTWSWIWYKERPQPVDTLGSLSLGMTPLEVSLAVGKPDNESAPLKETDESRWYLYNNHYDELEYFVRFSDKTESSTELAEIICTRNYQHDVFGLSKYSSEKEIKKKLGEPTSQSIRLDGLAKMISYEKWKVAFEIEKGDVIAVCISSSGKVGYKKEYGSEEDI